LPPRLRQLPLPAGPRPLLANFSSRVTPRHRDRLWTESPSPPNRRRGAPLRAGVAAAERWRLWFATTSFAFGHSPPHPLWSPWSSCCLPISPPVRSCAATFSPPASSLRLPRRGWSSPASPPAASDPFLRLPGRPGHYASPENHYRDLSSSTSRLEHTLLQPENPAIKWAFWGPALRRRDSLQALALPLAPGAASSCFLFLNYLCLPPLPARSGLKRQRMLFPLAEIPLPDGALPGPRELPGPFPHGLFWLAFLSLSPPQPSTV